MTTILVLAVIALFLLGLTAYAYAAFLVWQERTALGRMTRVLDEWIGKIILAAAAGVVMLVVVLIATARWAFAGGGRPSGLLDTLTAPERWKRTAAACSPKLAETPGRVKRIGGYTPTPSGGIYRVALPPGISWKQLDPDAVKSAFRARGAMITAGSHGHIAHVRIRRRDLLSSIIAAPQPKWTGHVVTLGRDEDGLPLLVDMTLTHVALGGTPRSGKSNGLHVLIAQYAANPKARIVILDGKEGAELGAWDKRCDGFDRGGDYQSLHFVELVRGVHAEISRRYKLLETAGFRNAAELQDAIDAGEKPIITLAPFLLVVDEVSTYIDQSKDFQALLIDVMKKGLGADVRVVISTQKATGDSMPTVLRDICDVRVAFKCNGDEMGNAILGRAFGRYAAELPSPTEDRAANAGRCIVAVGDSARLGRAFHASRAWLADAAGTRRVGASPGDYVSGEAPTRAGPRTGEAGARARMHVPAREAPTVRPLPTPRSGTDDASARAASEPTGRRGARRAKRRLHLAERAASHAAHRVRSAEERGDS